MSKLDNYVAPEGYIYDENTGLYYTQIIAEDELGNQSQVVNWFNPETGEYTQNVYPIYSDMHERNMGMDYADEMSYDGMEYVDADETESEYETESAYVPRNRKSFLKWILIGISGILMVALIVIIAHFAMNSNKEEPETKEEQSEISEVEVSVSEITVDDGNHDAVITDETDATMGQGATNVPSDADEYVSDDIYGVYKNEEMIVVVAPGVEHYQAAADGVYDMGTSGEPGFWILRYEPESEYMYFGTNVSLDNEVIIDYTENESGHVVNMAYGCMGEEMTYYELAIESGRQRDILLKKTKEDPVKAYYYYVDMYNKMVK